MAMLNIMEAKANRMSAIRSHIKGGAEGLVYEVAPRPVLRPGDVLIEVKAAAISPAEFTWPPSWVNADGSSRLPVIPSHEISGVVAEIGSDVTGLAEGQEVYGLIDFYRDGGAAEFVAAKAVELAPKPHSIDHVHAAAIPLSALTAWQAFRVRASLEAGQRVLIHGGAGGVGSYAVQIAKALGAETIATCSAANATFVKQMGADRVIEYDQARFEDFVRDADLVLDGVGSETLTRSWGVIRRGGTLISIVDEPSQETAARLGIRALFFIVEPNRGHLVELAKMVDAGKISPIVSKVFPLHQAREAYELGSRGHMRGKIVLSVG
ncbi:MAG TPA: NADP-dependent oxidoreductase [Candidatus Binataceae bacterium]|nr:NADP-dependent oxidoreductase [Candidatus Binataceae bacterium]